jgi:hypothetical protein
MGNSSSSIGIGPLIFPRMFEWDGWSGRPRPALDAVLNNPIVPKVEFDSFVLSTWQDVYTRRTTTGRYGLNDLQPIMVSRTPLDRLRSPFGCFERISSSNPLQSTSLAMRIKETQFIEMRIRMLRSSFRSQPTTVTEAKLRRDGGCPSQFMNTRQESSCSHIIARCNELPRRAMHIHA